MRFEMVAAVAVLMAVGFQSVRADDAPAIPKTLKRPIGVPVDQAAPGTVERVCAGVQRPGWAKVDDAVDPASPCKTAAADDPYNVWSIEKLDGHASGSEVEICRVKIVPMGWYRYQYKWDGNRCGHPKEHGEDNIMVIRHAH